MDNPFNFALQPCGPFSNLALAHKLDTLGKLFKYIKALSYQRISDKHQLALIFEEQCGTCSTKHAVVAVIAQEQQLKGLELMLGIYAMNESNTKGVGKVLDAYHLDFIPEAHTYLKLQNKRIDLTSSSNQNTSFVDDLFHEEIITPAQIIDYKDLKHQAFLKNWITENNIPYSFEEIWKIREACIAALSK